MKLGGISGIHMKELERFEFKVQSVAEMLTKTV